MPGYIVKFILTVRWRGNGLGRKALRRIPPRLDGNGRCLRMGWQTVHVAGRIMEPNAVVTGNDCVVLGEDEVIQDHGILLRKIILR